MASKLRRPIIVCYKVAEIALENVNPAERAALVTELVKAKVITPAVQKAIDMKTGGLIQAK